MWSEYLTDLIRILIDLRKTERKSGLRDRERTFQGSLRDTIIMVSYIEKDLVTFCPSIYIKSYFCALLIKCFRIDPSIYKIIQF